MKKIIISFAAIFCITFFGMQGVYSFVDSEANIGNHDPEIQYYLDISNLLEEGNSENAAFFYHKASKLFAEKGDYSNARKYNKKAIEILN